MAPHSSTLAWKIPWMEEPGRLPSMRSLRVVHDWVTSLSLFTFIHWRRKWQPTPVFLPGESQGEPGGRPSMGLHRVGHDWSDLAAAAGSPVAQSVKNLSAMQDTWVRSQDWEYLLEKEMATHSKILAWKIPWTEEPGGLQSMGSRSVGHWATNTNTGNPVCPRAISRNKVLRKQETEAWPWSLASFFSSL